MGRDGRFAAGRFLARRRAAMLRRTTMPAAATGRGGREPLPREATMSGASRLVRRAAFPALMSVALAFGAVQALATPAHAARAALSCSDEHCDANCVSRGYAYGDCSTGACRCFR